MPLTYKQRFNKKYNQPINMSNSLHKIAFMTGIKLPIIQAVYNRGIGAHKNNIRSVRMKDGRKNPSVVDKSKKMSAEQWGYGRVYSFVMRGKTILNADRDLFFKSLNK